MATGKYPECSKDDENYFDNEENIKAFFKTAEIEEVNIMIREFKVWGGKREENDSLYIWAKDADDAIGIARLTDQSICISQWTGNEKSYEEALEQEPCDDVISRAEAEAIFRNARSKLNPSDYKTADEFNTRDLMLLNAEQLIHLLPSVKPQEPKWIPVSERLPKEFEFVNCTCHSLIDDREDWVVETIYIPQSSGSPYSDWGNIPMLNDGKCEVIAWMHRNIPEPYKAEMEGEEESE